MNLICESALDCASKGLYVVPDNGKTPAILDWINQASNNLKQITAWFANGLYNIGILCGRISNLVIIDFDLLQPAREFFKKYSQFLHVIVRTPHGIHFWMRYPDDPCISIPSTSFRNLKIDILSDNRQAVAPPSIVNEIQYKFIEDRGIENLKDLHPFDFEFFGLPKPESQHSELNGGQNQNQSPIHPNEFEKISKQALAYVRTISSESGSHGHSSCYRVTALLKGKFQLPPEIAWNVLRQWNESGAAQPQWTIKELWHKHESVFYPKKQH